MSEEPDRVALFSDLDAVAKRLEQRITEEAAGLEQRITEEAAATRTHFNVIVERVESAVKLVAEVNAHHSTILSNHEARLQNIESAQSA